MDDIDLAFICLWIAFNACYAADSINIFENPGKSPEKRSIVLFLQQLVKCDPQGRLYEMLWQRFPSEIRLLLSNEFLFKPYWDRQRGEPVDYKTLFIISNNSANSYLAEGRVFEFLEIVLERLYILRNQVFHGGATHNGKVNRQQVNDGCRMLYHFVPIVIETMIDFSDADWGKIYYPVMDS